MKINLRMIIVACRVTSGIVRTSPDLPNTRLIVIYNMADDIDFNPFEEKGDGEVDTGEAVLPDVSLCTRT